jgi:hypothetical protein
MENWRDDANRMEHLTMWLWLWLIGATAVLWPIVVAHFYESAILKRIDGLSVRKRDKASIENLKREIQNEIRNIQKIIEHHDALIAALWEKNFEFVCQKHGYHNLKDTDLRPSEFCEYLGVKPNWDIFDPLWVMGYNYISRQEAYPWGTYGKRLSYPR